MKRIKFQFALILIAFVFSNALFAQSDYQIVQNFKQKFKALEDSIQAVNSIEDLNSLVTEIDRFRNEYLPHKDLLDKSLYPQNFESSFKKLNLEFLVRNKDLTQVDIYQTENIQLKEQVSELNKRNSELLSQIQQLEYITKKDKAQLEKLQKLVKNLKLSLKKRDDLIVGIVDSLMPQLMKSNASLTSKEKNEMFTRAEKNKVLANVKRSLKDNIRFLELTSLQPEDMNEVKKQQSDFSNFWHGAGVKLVDIYAERGKKAKEIAEIDSLFTQWQNAVNNEAWNSIKEEFAENKILLLHFSNGEEFTKVLTEFIDEEIKNIGVKSPESSEQTYSNFVDSTWYKVIQPKWIPFLLENKMITKDEKKQIGKKISEWKGKLTPASYDWLYLMLALVVIVVFIIFVRRKKSMPESPPEEKTKES